MGKEGEAELLREPVDHLVIVADEGYGRGIGSCPLLRSPLLFLKDQAIAVVDRAMRAFLEGHLFSHLLIQPFQVEDKRECLLARRNLFDELLVSFHVDPDAIGDEPTHLLGRISRVVGPVGVLVEHPHGLLQAVQPHTLLSQALDQAR